MHMVSSVVWHPSRATTMLSADAHTLRLWDVHVGKSTAAVVRETQTTPGEAVFSACVWNPHHGGTTMAAARGADVDGWDIRSLR